ncbi:hypothetical protein GCM10010922_21290 [Microbacterium sorbitolivorans]|nr:hypothetical protein GCM10010922_21290 [Microbacterium sorbitolivorans]
MLSMMRLTTASVRKPVRLLAGWPAYGCSWGSTDGAAHLPGMNDDRPRLWTPSELADYTGIPIRTLADWRTERARSRGLGLPFVVLSSHNIRYRNEDVEAFITSHLVAPTGGSAD